MKRRMSKLSFQERKPYLAPRLVPDWSYGPNRPKICEIARFALLRKPMTPSRRAVIDQFLAFNGGS